MAPDLHALNVALRAPTVVCSGDDGAIDSGRDPAAGIYHADVRALSLLRFTVEAVSAQDPPPRHTLGIEVDAGLVRAVLTVETPATVRCDLGTDLAGIDDVRSDRGLPRREPQVRDGVLAWSASTLEVEVEARPSPTGPAIGRRADGNPATTGAGSFGWHVAEATPGAPVELVVEVRLRDRSPVALAPRDPAPWNAPWIPDDVDPRLARWVGQSMADLDRLRLVTPDGPGEQFLAAGAPWYFTLFGRDSLWAARMLLPLGTGLPEGTLTALARRQGTVDDPVTEQQPGRILHELRRTSLVLGEGLRIPPVYYGTVDATPLWVCLLRDAVAAGMPDPERFAAPLVAAMAWIDQALDDGGGWLRYADRTGRGLANQGWKDSADAVRFADGRLARPPIALAEVQGYAYEALTGGADLLDAFLGAGAGDRFRLMAHDLATRFRTTFWIVDAGGFYPAMALDASGRPVDALASNMGHLLGTGILHEEESDAVALRLTDPGLDGGFGLRTLASDSDGYDPLSYHCGSVWPHDTAIAISGLAREGLTSLNRRQAFERLVEGLLAASEAFDARVPELWAGDTREDPVTGAVRRGPRPYASACRPQAWSSAASVAVLDAVLRTSGRAGSRAPV